MALAERQLQTYDEENVTVAASAVGLTLSKIFVTPPLKKVEIYVETAPIRYTLHGTDPTAAVGELVYQNSRIYIENSGDAERFRAIRSGSTSATLRVRYKR